MPHLSVSNHRQAIALSYSTPLDCASVGLMVSAASQTQAFATHMVSSNPWSSEFNAFSLPDFYNFYSVQFSSSFEVILLTLEASTIEQSHYVNKKSAPLHYGEYLPSSSSHHIFFLQPVLALLVQSSVIHCIVVSFGQELNVSVFPVDKMTAWF